MNYLEAVKILVNDPKAVAITFSSATHGTRRIELETKVYPSGRLNFLVFPATETKRKQNVVATGTDFLLREDFSIEYKEEKTYTADELRKTYEEGFLTGSLNNRQALSDERIRGFQEGLAQGKRDANAAAAKRFFTAYEELSKQK